MGVECLQPVRDANYAAHASLRTVLTLPDDHIVSGASQDDALAAWSAYLGTNQVLLVKSTDRARKLLMAGFGVDGKEPVAIPANTRRPLSEAVKRSKGTPLFVELDSDLNFVPSTPGLEHARLVWAQPVGGMPAPSAPDGKTLFVDYGFALPAPDIDQVPGAATIWGMHLSGSPADDGALVAFNDLALYEAVRSSMTGEDLPDPMRAVAQCSRLGDPGGLAEQQLIRYAAAEEGLDLAGALPRASMSNAPTLPFGLAIRIPDEADIATFISYVRNENLVLDWLPEIQPMFYVTYQVTRNPELTRQTAGNLARWFISPIGPDFAEDEITHCVLGPVKASEYTGVRWYTNLERARWYNDLMLEWYGPDHDAYRCAFTHMLPEIKIPVSMD